MSTAEMGTPADLAANMKTVIRTLMMKAGIGVGEMRAALPMAKNTWLRRMANGDWSAPELVRIAAILDVPVGALFAHPDAIQVGDQKLKILSPVDFDGPPEDPTPPVRGHLSLAK